MNFCYHKWTVRYTGAKNRSLKTFTMRRSHQKINICIVICFRDRQPWEAWLYKLWFWDCHQEAHPANLLLFPCVPKPRNEVMETCKNGLEHVLNSSMRLSILEMFVSLQSKPLSWLHYLIFQIGRVWNRSEGAKYASQWKAWIWHGGNIDNSAGLQKDIHNTIFVENYKYGSEINWNPLQSLQFAPWATHI